MTPEQLQAIQQYYANLLIYQYKGMPKAYQTVSLYVNQALCDGLFFTFPAAFNLNTAVGAQLTIIGKIVGVPREIFGIAPYATYFSFTRSQGRPASIGFNRANTPVDPDYILRAQVQNTYTLTDFEMLSLIKLKIIFNNVFSSFSQLKKALLNNFPPVWIYPTMAYNQPGDQAVGTFYWGGYLSEDVIQVASNIDGEWFTITGDFAFINNGNGTYSISLPQGDYPVGVVTRIMPLNPLIDIVSPDTGKTYFNFTRARGVPASVGFNRASTPVDPDNIMRTQNFNWLMQLNYNVRQPYYVVATIAKFLDIFPRSMGVGITVNQI